MTDETQILALLRSLLCGQERRRHKGHHCCCCCCHDDSHDSSSHGNGYGSGVGGVDVSFTDTCPVAGSMAQSTTVNYYVTVPAGYTVNTQWWIVGSGGVQNGSTFNSSGGSSLSVGPFTSKTSYTLMIRAVFQSGGKTYATSDQTVITVP